MKDQNSVGTMFDVLAKAMQPHTQLMKLNAIWIEKGIRVYNESNSLPKVKLTHRIAEGDVLSLDENTLVDYGLGDDREVLKCIWTLDNAILQVKLQNTNTQEIKTVTI